MGVGTGWREPEWVRGAGGWINRVSGRAGHPSKGEFYFDDNVWKRWEVSGVTPYVVSFYFGRHSSLYTFRCEANGVDDAVAQCLAFNPGVSIVGAFTQTELKQH